MTSGRARSFLTSIASLAVAEGRPATSALRRHFGTLAQPNGWVAYSPVPSPTSGGAFVEVDGDECRDEQRYYVEPHEDRRTQEQPTGLAPGGEVVNPGALPTCLQRHSGGGRASPRTRRISWLSGSRSTFIPVERDPGTAASAADEPSASSVWRPGSFASKACWERIGDVIASVPTAALVRLPNPRGRNSRVVYRFIAREIARTSSPASESRPARVGLIAPAAQRRGRTRLRSRAGPRRRASGSDLPDLARRARRQNQSHALPTSGRAIGSAAAVLMGGKAP
jgi:hypothetical protein